jgi:hypothetical protein
MIAMRKSRLPVALLACTLLASITFAADAPNSSPVPLIHCHAHNDYEHPHPFFDAEACGFCSFEADIHLVDGKLLVAHNRAAVRPDRTLESLYLDPMKKQIEANGGRLYRNGPPVWLLIDVKGDADATYMVLREVLKKYESILTSWRDGKKHQGAITAVISGNRARKLISDDKDRYCAIDGLLSNLQTGEPADLVPWISEAWSPHFKWRGTGPMPDEERGKLRQIVATAHQQDRLVRFWGAPDNPTFWKEIRDDGVDLINTDHLEQCRDFLLKEGKESVRN